MDFGTVADGGSMGGAAGSGGGGTGGAAGASNGGGGAGASAAGSGGASAPLFPCIEGWPTRPAGAKKAVPLDVQPQTLWTLALPPSGDIIGGIAATGNGAAVSHGYSLSIADGSGSLVTTLAKPDPSRELGGRLSGPVAGPDGSVYFADASNAYGIDPTGKTIWHTRLGPGQLGQSANAAPSPPILDPAGRLYLSALDGKLWSFKSADGEVLWSLDVGFWQGAPRWLDSAVRNVLTVSGGTAVSGVAAGGEGLLSVETRTWFGSVVMGEPAAPPRLVPGYDVGFVVSAVIDVGSETLDTFIVDTCGNFRWRVPGDHAVLLAITFDDDLIVMDRTPLGGGRRSFALRRFSKDGVLVAGPVSVSDQFCGSSFVGADDTFYYVGYTPSGPSEGYRLRAFDSSLREKWVSPFPFCPNAAVLNADGKILAARGTDSKLVAVQTTSPGPGAVSWAQNRRNARATAWLAP